MKKLFLLFLSLLCVITGFSQNFIMKENLRKVEKSKILKEGDLSRTFPNRMKSSALGMQKVSSGKVDTLALKYGDKIVNGVGVGSTATLFPLSLFYVTPYAGTSLTKVNIGLMHDVTNLKIHIRTTIDGNDLYTQDVGNLTAGWHTVTLTTPYQISTSALVIGYEASAASTADQDSYILGITDNTTFLNYASYIKMDGSYYTQSYGCWAIQGVLEGDNLPQNEIGLYSINTKVVKSNEPFAVRGLFWNLGAKPVGSCEIGYNINGVSGSQTVKMDSVSPYNLGDFSLNIPAANIAHQDSAVLSLEVNKVNEVDDDYSGDNSGSSYLTSTDVVYPHRVVAEEGTGAWCGWCVRGIVGMENMRKKHPETFIPIAIHDGDKQDGNNRDGLEIDPTLSYSYLGFIKNYISSYPTCIIDRKYSNDPFYGIEDVYNEEQSEPCLFDYKYKSLTYNSSTGLVSATVTTTSAFNFKNTNCNGICCR